MTATAKFVGHLREALAQGILVRLLLTSPRSAQPVQRVIARVIELRGAPHLACTLREARRDTQANLPLSEACAWVEQQLTTQFAGALLETTQCTWQLRAMEQDAGRLVRQKAKLPTAPPPTHDQPKPSFLGDAAKPGLMAFELLAANGKVLPQQGDKFAQVERFAELFLHLARDCGWQAPLDRPLQVVDVGCGKGRLTFAIWHVLRSVLGQPAHVRGIELRDELVQQANARARTFADDSLRFSCGDIATAPLAQLDALVALHACDQATDLAIRAGISQGAQLILVAPCCHQEARPNLCSPDSIAPALQHGLMAERLAEWATDALRALHLECNGYRVKMIEFVSLEHTGKNLLLSAVRRAEPLREPERQAATARRDAFAAAFGLQTLACLRTN